MYRDFDEYDWTQNGNRGQSNDERDEWQDDELEENYVDEDYTDEDDNENRDDGRQINRCPCHPPPDDEEKDDRAGGY